MKIKIPNKNYTLVELYDEVATQLGYDSATCEYDCTKTSIAENIQEMFFRYYKELNPDKSANDVEMGVAMMLVCSGPKANKNLANDEVEVLDGFVIKQEAV